MFFISTDLCRGVVALLTIATLASGCNYLPSLPDVIALKVFNQNFDGAFITCAGGLEGSFTVGSLQLQTPKVAAGEEFEVSELRPEDAPSGAKAVAEATCYGAQGQEIGYSRVEAPWHEAHTNGVYIHGAVTSLHTNPTACLPAIEVRGDPPCIDSSLLE